MSDKRIFKIGQLVKVNLNKQAIANYEHDNRLVKRSSEWYYANKHSDELLLARITGAKRYWEGKYTAGSKMTTGIWDNFEFEPEGAYTTQDKQITVWGVRLGYVNKEIYFFAEDIVSAGVSVSVFKQEVFYPDNKDIPYFWNGGWSEHMKAKLGKESKTWPRDKKGRWKK